MTPNLNGLIDTVQMRGQNIWFYAELTKIIPNYKGILLGALRETTAGYHINKGGNLETNICFAGK